MEGNPGKRLIAPRPRMCAVEAQRRLDCVSAVLQRCLHAERLSGRFSTPTGVLGVPEPDAPFWTIDLLVSDNDRDLGR
jgi:hypothetical protein